MLTGHWMDWKDESMAKLHANPKLFTASYLKKEKLFKFDTIEHDNSIKDEPVALDDVQIVNNLWYCMTWRYKKLSNLFLFKMKHTQSQMHNLMIDENAQLKDTVQQLQHKLQVMFVFCVMFSLFLICFCFFCCFLFCVCLFWCSCFGIC